MDCQSKLATKGLLLIAALMLCAAPTMSAAVSNPHLTVELRSRDSALAPNHLPGRTSPIRGRGEMASSRTVSVGLAVEALPEIDRKAKVPGPLRSTQPHSRDTGIQG